MTGIDAPTLWQVTYTVAGVAVAAAAAGLLCVRLLARRSLATLLFVVAAVVIVSSMAGVGVIAYKMMISVDDRNVVLAVVAVLRTDFIGILQRIDLEDVDWDAWRNFYNEGRTPRSAVDRALERDL